MRVDGDAAPGGFSSSVSSCRLIKKSFITRDTKGSKHGLEGIGRGKIGSVGI
jgi:hypothetical protein